MKDRARILVTGGSGFLGSHLCAFLLAKGHEVICVDNFFTGSPDAVKPLLENQRMTLVRHDITEPLQFDVDRIFNLACPASPVQYQRDPVQTIRTNVLGAINMLDLAVRSDAVILQASTSEVYGDPTVHPQTEAYWGNVNPIGPRSCYDEGKRCAETLFFDYHRQHGVAIKIARIFNTYGPGMHMNDGRVVSNFIVQALTNRDIVIHGKGDQTRSFCYVDDLIEALAALIETPGNVTGPLNLGNPAEISILALAQTIIDLTGSSSRLRMVAALDDDPKRRRPDIAAAQELLGWRPTTPLEQGLKKTIAYFEDVLSSHASFAPV